MGAGVTVGGATVVVVGAGYPGKRSMYERMAQLGARLVMVEETGHWSEQLVAEGVASRWIAVPVTGDHDVDAAAVLEALSAEGIRPDGTLTFWELSVPVVARVAASLGLPGNPVEAVDAARSKLRNVKRPSVQACPHRGHSGSRRWTSFMPPRRRSGSLLS